MDLSSRAGDIVLSLGTIAFSTILSLALGAWFNRHQERRSERQTDVDEFSEHRQAFRDRIADLESKCATFEARIEELERDHGELERRYHTAMQVNFSLQSQLEDCREEKSRRPRREAS